MMMDHPESSDWELGVHEGGRARPLVYVVMLTYDGRRHLCYSLPSLFQTDYDPMVVLVVDNYSREDIASYVASLGLQARVVRTERNLQWAGGNNVGVQMALAEGADYVCLVNDDVLFSRHWLGEAVAVAERCAATGIVGFRMFDSRMNDSRELFERAMEEWSKVDVRPTTNVSGAAMLVRRQVFEHIGLFDEIYRAYCEENDFESRAMRAGYQMWEVNLPVWHQSGGTFSRTPIMRSYLSMRNIVRYGIKNRSLGYTIRTVGHIFRIAISPLLRTSDLGLVDRRYRPSCVPINLALVLGALGWNVFHLPQTIAQRRRDRVRIEQGGRPCASC